MQRDDEEQALDDAQGRRSGQYPHHLRGPGSGVGMGSELHQEPHQSGNLNDVRGAGLRMKAANWFACVKYLAGIAGAVEDLGMHIAEENGEVTSRPL